MADKYTNPRGVEELWKRIKAVFLKKNDEEFLDLKSDNTTNKESINQIKKDYLKKTDTPEKAYWAVENGVEFIMGTQPASTQYWEGTTKDAYLINGKQIAYWLPYESTQAVTLNLKLATGKYTGNIPVYFHGYNRLTSQYRQQSIINMTYVASRGAWYVNADYDTNTNYSLTVNSYMKVKESVNNGIIVGTPDGYINVSAGAKFDLSYPILYSVSGTRTGAYNQFYYYYYGADLGQEDEIITPKATNSGVIYLVGTINGNEFTIDEHPLTDITPTTENGKVYLRIGPVSWNSTGSTVLSRYYMFAPDSTLYEYKNGKFGPISGGDSPGQKLSPLEPWEIEKILYTD